MSCREPEEDDSAPWKEQENWEGDQIKRALIKASPKDRKPPAEQYEYVFENQIDFITDAAARGEMVSSLHSWVILVAHNVNTMLITDAAWANNYVN